MGNVQPMTHCVLGGGLSAAKLNSLTIGHTFRTQPLQAKLNASFLLRFRPHMFTQGETQGPEEPFGACQ